MILIFGLLLFMAILCVVLTECKRNKVKKNNRIVTVFGCYVSVDDDWIRYYRGNAASLAAEIWRYFNV